MFICLVMFTVMSTADAHIYRWDNGDLLTTVDAEPYVDLSSKNLTHADLADANLANADMSGISMYYADLTGANLTEADMTFATAPAVNYNHANLSNAELLNADMSHSTMVFTCFTGANLHGVTLNDSDLSNANLRETNLNYTDLIRCNLSGADMTGALNCENADFTDAIYNLKTIFPTEFDPVAEGMILIPCNYVLAGDLNGDCKFNLEDFAIIAANWMVDCNANPLEPGCISK